MMRNNHVIIAVILMASTVMNVYGDTENTTTIDSKGDEVLAPATSPDDATDMEIEQSDEMRKMVQHDGKVRTLVEIHKGQLIDTIDLPKEYEISFDLLLAQQYRGKNIARSIIQFKSGGISLLNIYKRHKDKWKVEAYLNKKKYNFYFKNFRRGTTYALKICQKWFFGTYYFTIRVNGMRLIRRANHSPQTFFKTKVYVGSPWYKPQKGYLYDLYYGTPKYYKKKPQCSSRRRRRRRY